MDAKRGYVPEDARNFSEEAIRNMRTASGHIRYLINEGYDKKHAATFVGNHFMMSERQRLAVMRSLATDEQLLKRRRTRKQITELAGEEVWIDGFNTIITLEVMLSDSILLSCMDGAIRDLAALRGTYRLIPETEEAVRILLHLLEGASISRAHILLDAPVSNSGRLKTLIAKIGEEASFIPDIQVLRDLDRFLYEKGNVITSDSIILDHCKSWVNLIGEYVKGKGITAIRVWDKDDDPDEAVIREMLSAERDLLKDFLYEAIFIPEGDKPPDRDIVNRPELQIYYEDFGSGPADHCLVAEADGRIVGAVWTRIMHDYGYVDDTTPSFAISLIPEYRGRGIGTRLMKGLQLRLKEQGWHQASLAVQKANYAVRMYEKLGFFTVDENDEEYIMVCRL